MIEGGRQGRDGFVAGTPILMGDGSQRAIEAVAVGDLVLAYEAETGKLVRRPVVELTRTTAHVARVRTSAGVLGVTPSHCFYTRGIWIPVVQLAPGTPLVTSNGRTLGTASLLECLAPPSGDQAVPVYDLTVAREESYFAGGVLVDNAAAD